MAYVPDDAMDRKHEISRSAWDVYETLCRFGDADYGFVECGFAKLDRLVAITRLARGTVKNALTELRKEGWTETRGGRIRLLVGTFLEEIQRRKDEARRRPKSSPHSDDPARQESPVSDRKSLVNDPSSPTNDSESFTSDSAYIDRARGLTSPSTSPETSTHTPAPASSAASEAPAARVCVSMPKSKFPRGDCLAWAAARKAAGGQINPDRVGRARWMDGLADDEIAEWKARDAAAAARAPETVYMSKGEAGQKLQSLKDSGNACDIPATLIAMPVTEETRAQLRQHFSEYFVGRSEGKGPEARAHAPP